MAEHNKIGQIGEAIAVVYLQKQGFYILDCNYRKKWGEIDVIAQKEATIHFVEVKTVSYETKEHLHARDNYGLQPQEQLTMTKYQKLVRTIETWLVKEGYKGHYQLDLVAVHMIPHETYAQVEYFESVSLD